MSKEQMAGVESEGLETKGLQIWGDVKFRSDAVLTGAVQGRVESLEKIILSPGTLVSGVVRGSDIRVEGEVQGGVEAKGTIWLGPKSKVNVRCFGLALRIEPGAEFRGELQVG